MHKQRLNMALNIGGYATVGLGFAWAIFFSARQMWLLSAVDIVVALVGLSVLLFAKQGHTDRAAYILLTSMYFIAIVMCLFIDIPSPAAPRSIHHYFLVLACLSFLFFQTNRAWLKYGIPALFMATYIIFASSPLGIVTSYALPDDVRIAGTWINNSLAMLLVYLILYIMLSEINVLSEAEQDLKLAVQNNQLALYYQAQVDNNGNIWGAEALLRWNHPARGLVSPNEFIPLAEQTGLILAVGNWVLNAACAQLAQWAKNPHFAHLTLSVNVSAKQFHQPNFVNQTISSVQRAGANAAKLKLELTESILVQDVDGIVKKMTTLKTAGIGFALDDFGTGYSSLNYLKRLPLDQLKIDQSFVRDVLTDENDAAIARTITTLGNSLGLKVVAEGVETNEQRQFLIENGCLAFQGHLFSHALPIQAFESFVNGANRMQLESTA